MVPETNLTILQLEHILQASISTDAQIERIESKSGGQGQGYLKCFFY